MVRRALQPQLRGLFLLALFTLACTVLLLPGRAFAHGGHTGPSQTFTQVIGPYELAVTLELPSSAPAPLYIDVAPQNDVAGATFTFRAAPRGQSFANAQPAVVQGAAGPQGIYFTQVDLDRTGDWVLEITSSGPRGSGVARIPFTTIVAPVSYGSIGLFVALGGLVVLMIVSIIVGIATQRSGKRAPAWVNWTIGQAMFACLIAAVILGVQQFNNSVQSAQAAATDPTALGRPHANMQVRTEAVNGSDTLLAGKPMTLTLDLSDGSTGLPVDDLVTHHDALLHLVVISKDNGYYEHIHPARFEPGEFAIQITPDRPGIYTAYAEIQRQDSGTQVLARNFEVGGTATPPPVKFEGLGDRTVDGMQIKVASSLSPLKAGKQTTLTFSFSKDGQPVNDLEPWLGMGGHLLARNDDGSILAHVHAVGPMAPGGILNSGFVYGPDIQFVYTFPEPGNYYVWGQFRHGGQIVTVPLEVNVE